MEGLSSISVVAYSELLTLCLILTLQLIIMTAHYRRNGSIATSKTIYLVYSSYMVLFVSELMWILISYFNPQMVGLTTAFNTVWFVFLVLAPMFWLMFCEYEFSSLISKNRIKTFFVMLPAVLAAVFAATSPIHHLTFYTDSSGTFHKETGSIVLIVLSIIYYFISIVQAMYKRIVSKDEDDIIRSKLIITFCIPIISTLAIQIYWDRPISTIGYMLALSSTFMNLIISTGFTKKLKQEKMQYDEILQSDREMMEKIEYERLNDSIVQAKNSEVIRSLAEDFIFVCYVNLPTSEVTIYHETPEIQNMFDSFTSNMFSFEKLDAFLKSIIVEEDFEKLHNRALNPSAVASLLKQGKTTEDFRANIDGSVKHYRLKLAVDKDNPNGIIYGIYSVDELVRQRETIDLTQRELNLQREIAKNRAIFENLANDYECVSYISVESGREDTVIDVFRDSSLLKDNVPGWKDRTSTRARIVALAGMIPTEKERKDFREKLKLSTVLLHFLTEDAYYVNFKIYLLEQIHHYQIKITAVKNSEGVITALVAGLKNIDEVVKNQDELLRLEREEFEHRAFTNLFIDTYTAAFYVNLKDYSYVTYKLDESLVNTFTIYPDFIRTIASYIENKVYDSDKEMMYKATNPDEIREKLKTSSQYAVVYRDIQGGDPSYRNMIITGGHDADHLAVGFIDVSEQFAKEREIQDSLKSYIMTIEKQQLELEEANKAKTNFLFNMSHDIRTPMNAIIGYTDLAKEHITETERASKFLDKIALSGEHLLKLINEILDMSRIEGGKIHSEMSTVDIAQSAGKIVDICKEEAFIRNIDFDVNFSGIENCTVYMDELHVNQIILNVLSNAIKYTQEGGKVSFGIKELPASVSGYKRFEYRIADNGIGMSEEFLEHIFDSFSRERTSTVSGIQGTGLGMAIVKKLVDYMDGTIDIESKVGEGTVVTVCFQFIIPLEDEDNQEDTPIINDTLRGKRALFVDDNEINREIIRTLLEEVGMVVSEAVNGKDAIAIVDKKGIEYFDFILMDIQMPVMNGYEATKYLRETYSESDIPIIALSANAFEEDVRKSLESGMNEHISKPVSAATLYKTVAKYLQIK